MAAPPSVIRALLLLAVAACGRLRFAGGDELGDGGAGEGDAPDAAAGPCGSWGSIRHLSELSSPGEDWEPTLSGDGLTLVFTRNNPRPEMWIATRDTTTSSFTNVREANELDDDVAAGSESFGAMWSPDFKRLYYLYVDPSANGFIRMADYDASTATFGTPMATDFPSSGASWDITLDQRELFITRQPAPDDYDLAHATRDDIGSPWRMESTFAADNSEFVVLGWPSFDDARQQLYAEVVVNSQMRIAVAQRSRRGEPFSSFELVPDLDFIAGDPDISPDGTTLVFASDGLGDGSGNEIYMATRSCP